MSSGFVTASDVEEEKKKRQEEWEKVRKPEDPIVAPEPEVCNKTLFEQLRDNREAKQEEIDEAKKFKNMIRGIDEDESEFLAHVDNIKSQQLLNKRKEEQELLKEVAAARTQVIVESPTVSQINRIIPTTDNQTKSKQASILSSAIKRKSTSGEGGPTTEKQSRSEEPKTETGMAATSATQLIGFLPGIVDYDGSSESDSSDSDEDSDPVVGVLATSKPEPNKSCNQSQ